MAKLKYRKGIAADGDVFRVRIIVAGKVVKGTFRTLADARSFIEHQKAGAAPASAPEPVEAGKFGVTVADMVREVGDSIVRSRRGENGRKVEARQQDTCVDRFGPLDASDVTVKRVMQWARDLHSEGRQGSTVKKYLNTLNALYKESRAQGLIPAEAVSPVPQAIEVLGDSKADIINNGRKVGRRVSDDEIKAVCAELPHYQRLIWFAVESSFRSGEICALTWGDVDFERHVIYVIDQKQKEDNQWRVAPMTPEMETLLVGQFPKDRVPLDSEPVFPRMTKGGAIDTRNPRLDADALGQRWRKAVERAGIEHARFHDLRHEACSRLGERSFPGIGYLNVVQIQMFSGHRTLEMVQRYVHASPATFAEALHAETAPKGKVVRFQGRKRA